MRTRIFANFRNMWLLTALASPLAGADRSTPAAAAMAESIARQKQAVSSMAASLQAQRRSVLSQVGRRQAASLFRSPPLPPLPSGASSPASEPALCPPLAAGELEMLVGQAARREELEPELLRSVIRQESAARPCAVSPKGAMGLMQLMPATALQLGVADAFDPKENVDGGARLLKQLLTMYGGDVSLALGAFNAGPAKVSPQSGLPDYPETLEYVQKVLSLLPPAH